MRNSYYRKEYLVIAIMIVIKLCLNIITNINAGLDGDEIMHIDSGNHLAWGYMSIQPLVGLIGWIQNLFHSESVFIHHLFAHITGALIMLLSGLTVIKLGGKWKAVLLTLLCIVVAPGFTYSQHIFTPLVFEQFFWLLGFYMTVAYCKDKEHKYLLYLSIILALGFMTKISILIFIGSLCVAILLHHRALFTQKIAWICLLVFFVLITPNIVWQYHHDFPSIKHMATLRHEVLAHLDIMDNLQLLFLSTNPFTSIVWITGVFVAPFVYRRKDIRLATTTLLVTFIILAIFRGQFHYYFPTILIAFVVGSVMLQRFFERKARIMHVYLFLLVTSTLFLTPKLIPILPLDRYIEYLGLDHNNNGTQVFYTQQSIADNKMVNTGERIPINFEAYYTHNDWSKLVKTIDTLYHQLPQQKKEHCFIWTRCYTQAGAINLYGKKYNLPFAFSQHGNCYEWIPQFDKQATIIVVANAQAPIDSDYIGAFFSSSFDTLSFKKAIFCPFARTSYNAYYMIYLGEGLKYNSEKIKVKYQKFIFE